MQVVEGIEVLDDEGVFGCGLEKEKEKPQRRL